MDNTQNNTPVESGNGQLGNQFLDALLHFLYRIIYFLFVLPFDLWKKAVIRMSEQRKQKSLDVTTINTDYPFLSWLKRFLFEFLFDGIIVISWIVGVIIALVGFFKGIGDDYLSIGTLIVSLYSAYVIPILVTIVRDLTTICVVMPMRWWISFLRRPAKTYDLTHEGKLPQ